MGVATSRRKESGDTPKVPSDPSAEVSDSNGLGKPEGLTDPAEPTRLDEPDSTRPVQIAESSDDDAKSVKHVAIVTEKLESYECGDITRMHTFQGIFLASQPLPADFAQARKGGVRTVINLRHPEEIKDFNEPELVANLGMAYHNPASDETDELTDAIFEELRELLKTVERPVLLHCSSANRVGAIWLAYRVLDGGPGVEEALVEAKTVGLMSPDYEEIAKPYIQREKERSTDEIETCNL